jgi:hypothetical protein
MFDKKSLNSIRGNRANKQSTMSRVVSQDDSHTAYRISNKDDAEFLMNFSLQSIRYGLLLSHQPRMKNQGNAMIKNLFIKNFPEQADDIDLSELPMEEIENLIDKDSGKHFGTIMHEQMIDDWAHDPKTKFSIDILDGMTDDADPEEFFDFMNETSEMMAKSYRTSLQMNAISPSIN